MDTIPAAEYTIEQPTEKFEVQTGETAETEEYHQYYPIQPYQKAYAEFLFFQDTSCTAYMIHIDEDTIPELVVTLSDREAAVYSFDGTEIYEVGIIGLGYYSLSFTYRPYLGMIAYDTGSAMYGNSHTDVQIFTKENGRLQIEDTVHIVHSESNLMTLQHDAELYGLDYEYLYGYEEAIPYDMYIKQESWRSPDDYLVTGAQIAYWFTNG